MICLAKKPGAETENERPAGPDRLGGGRGRVNPPPRSLVWRFWGGLEGLVIRWCIYTPGGQRPRRISRVAPGCDSGISRVAPGCDSGISRVAPGQNLVFRVPFCKVGALLCYAMLRLWLRTVVHTTVAAAVAVAADVAVAVHSCAHGCGCCCSLDEKINWPGFRLRFAIPVEVTSLLVFV